MNACCQKLFRRVKNRDGFTLIEMLIVIIILGILAMAIIPQISVSTDDAKVSTLKSNLSAVRSAIETYYAQHNQTYPGVAGDGTNAAGTALAFINQLTQFSTAAGVVAGTKTATAIYGPYIKGGIMPSNPFITDPAKSNLVTVAATADVTTARSVLAGGNGWAYWYNIGIFYANEDGSSGGVLHYNY